MATKRFIIKPGLSKRFTVDAADFLPSLKYEYNKKDVKKALPPRSRIDVELTRLQFNLMHAVQNLNQEMFTQYGGTTSSDINFKVSKDGAFPLMIAVEKSYVHFVNLLLTNPTI